MSGIQAVDPVLGTRTRNRDNMEPMEPVVETSGKRAKHRDEIANKNGFRPYVHWITGDLYCGDWAHNKRDGCGIHVYKNGNRYEGQWKNGKREGRGIFWTIDKGKFMVLYRGEWKNGLFEGKGVLNGECGEKYDGSFVKGMRHGLGKQTYFTGKLGVYAMYHGEWKEDRRHGVGSLKMANGDVYEGHFIDGVKEGPGIYYFAKISAKYEGVWRNDMLLCGSYVKPKKTKVDILPYQDLENHTIYTDTIMSDALEETKFCIQ